MSQLFAQPRDAAALARSAVNTGRLAEARRHFGRAVADSPRDAMLLVEAAVVEGQLGDLKAAERLLEKALKLEPDNADAWYNLAEVGRERDQLDRAVRQFRRALALNRDHVNAAFGLGEALYCQGKAEEALGWLDEALRRAPEDAEVLHVKALALDHLGRARDALAAYREVLRLQPDHVNAAINLAGLSAREADPLESLELIDKAEASGIPAGGYAVAAHVLHLAGHSDRASSYVERALEAGVHAAEALTTRANILIDSADFDAAETVLHEVLKLNKDSAWAHYRLAVIKRLRPEAERALLRQANDRSTPAPTRTFALFALYHLYDEAGDHERAFDMLVRANTLKGAATPFDVGAHEAYCQRIIDTYSPEHIAATQPCGYQRPGPIFIVGMPRSGTTLTEQILAAHPDVFACGERLDLQRIVAETRGWPEAALGLDEHSLQEQGRTIHDSMLATAEDRPLATEKNPAHYLFVGAIACMLPQAKLVYVRRQPGDNALSLYEQSFLRGLDYAYDLAKIGAVYRQHQRLMQHWIDTCGLAVHTVDYDALVHDPEPHIRRLLAFVGLDFRPECLAPHRVERAVRTSSAWQVRQPISAGSVGRWRRYEKQFQPFIEALEGRS